ncbi:TonB-dependent receptor [Tamlana sp. 2_MG-2023]|uniref:SusC/RagA family TonB-linked outer membrane protein n=1 Tax=unclassified Tamlana TaxID=2614803 RepID=UPI0026E449BB|nr:MULTISPECIES: TonB-dependent receptor [unclassified Tamlana]MDO6761236.1 TonB-dependent receptor [Tamlana sp. 2_MG-2023]MDO6791719.1 TonB-dependent receptor [Tamlana sp. 1_MG-2023]
MKIRKLLLKKNVASHLAVVFLALLCNLNASSQSIAVTGTVTGVTEGADYLPIPGATVLVQGTNTGAVTDFDGNFYIDAKIGDVLVVSYIGMLTEKVTVKGKTVSITLKEDLDELDEVVVIGYGSVKKKEITGAVTQVKAEDITSVVTSDLASALQGQASGVNVVASSEPGGEAQILIRGITSLSGDNTPLYVVDGIVQNGDPNIPPTEIESINILKDAASTAIYGVRGATGVILITTKQGKPGSLQVRLNGSYAIQHRNAAVPLMNSLEQTYADIIQNRNVNGGFDDETGLQIKQQTTGFQNESNINDLIFNQNVPTQNYNLNVSGGSEDITYNVNLGLFDQRGLQINSGYRRFNVRANTVYEKNKLKIQTSVALNTDNREIPQGFLLSQSIVYRPTQNGINIDNQDDFQQGGDDVNRLGWVLESLNTTNVLKTTRSSATLNLNYEILDGLSVTGNFGLTSINNIGKIVRPYTEIYNTQDPPRLQSQPEDAYIDMRTRFTTNVLTELGATYTKIINDDHNLTFTLFGTAEQNASEAFSARRNGATNPNIEVLNGATGTQIVNSGFDYTDSRIGIIGRVQYGYKDRYILSSSVRRDGSSKFPEQNHWGTFPSIAAAWNISEEAFWTSKTINNARLRLSSGTVGVDRFQSYAFSAAIQQDLNYPTSSGAAGLGAAQTDFVNTNVGWESTTQNNIGFDLGLLKNKITLAAEYYHSDKTDMLFPVYVPPSSGGGNNAQVVLNVGDMTNSGFEFTAGYRGNIGKVNFRMNGTFSTNENEITKINNNTEFILTDDNGLVGRAPQQSRVTALAVGHEAASFYLWRTDGIIDTDEKLAEYQKINSNARMGDTRFIDQNNDGQLDVDDRVYSGSGLPEFEIGYTFNANWKNFDFSMNWYAAIGQEIMNGFNAWAYGYGRHKDLLYQWQEANPTSTIPAYVNDMSRHPNYLGYSDLWLEDGSYLRLRQASLGYSIPRKTVENWGVNRLRFYVRAQNPLTFTKYSGYNPEVGGGISARGLDKDTGPISSQWMLGVNFDF